MTKKQLYIVIALLSALLLYVFFMPTQPRQDATVDVPVLQKNEETISSTETTEVVPVAEASEKNEDTTDKTVVLEGTFVGLLPAENEFEKKYTFLLLNDGTEVLRIDLRPLIGYSDINVIEKLGVDRGDEIQVSGVMNDTEFVVKSID